ncbi:class I adenylate-forming enzyme family protein [Actinomadura sp. 1N219]|uniref:class I adenylate-forming enzyme family protein n=1 Tax=Actinomadura sp. 1N219 TaxID=3375152 RepID=UPI0037A18184
MTLLQAWAQAVRREPGAPALTYFDRTLDRGEVEAQAAAFAAALLARGFGHGDRLAVCLQNVPQFVVAALAAWRIGAVVVPVNPMYRTRELHHVLADSGARALVCLERSHGLAEAALPDTAVEFVVTTSELDHQSADDRRLLADSARQAHPGADDMAELIARYAPGTPGSPLAEDDLALLVYTSGTTGPPKGAMTTHANLAFGAAVYRDRAGVGPGDVVLGMAPLCHITGLVGHLAVALLAPAELVLTYRFHPEVALEAFERRSVTFTIAAITAYKAIMALPAAEPARFRSVKALYSGGAPIAPAVAERAAAVFGHRLHNAYGLTESTSITHMTPLGAEHRVAGALSVGPPVPGVVARVVSEDGREPPPGTPGELVIEGPGVVAGYWRNPEATGAGLPGGVLRTGDVAWLDEDGWCYVVDRAKDQINASGFKVWPREVEDALQEHAAVREAAVVGVPDDYRGETVKGYVVLHAGARATPEELISFVRQALAAYKCPRAVEIVTDLPRTASGKILRRALRDTGERKGAPS